MKKIKIELTQTGTDEFVAQSAITIKIGDKKIEGSRIEVMNILKEVAGNDFSAKIYDSILEDSTTIKGIRIITKNSNMKKLLFNRPLPTFLSSKDVIEEFKYVIESLKSFKKQYEETLFEMHKTTKNYTFVI